MSLAIFLLALAGVSPEEGVTLVDASAKTLERGGLYVVVIVLLAGLIGIFVIKERQLQRFSDETKKQLDDKDAQVRELHGQIISMVEKQTAVLTEANLTARNIEKHLERLYNKP